MGCQTSLGAELLLQQLIETARHSPNFIVLLATFSGSRPPQPDRRWNRSPRPRMHATGNRLLVSATSAYVLHKVSSGCVLHCVLARRAAQWKNARVYRLNNV